MDEVIKYDEKKEEIIKGVNERVKTWYGKRKKVNEETDSGIC